MQRSCIRILAFVMSLLIAAGVCNASRSVPESLAKWSAGKRIEVTLNNGDKLIGHLGKIESDSFVLEPDKRKGTQRVLRFEEVRSVKSKMTATQKWAIAVGVWAALAVIGSRT